MKYFFDRLRFTKGDYITGGVCKLFVDIVKNIFFWMIFSGILLLMWTYVYDLPAVNISMIIGFCLYLFILSKIYRSRSCVPVETISWAFTGKFALFEAFIAFLCAGTNAEMVYNSCGKTLKTVGYFLATFLFVYFCLRVSLISVIVNWKKSNSLWLLLHMVVIALFATALITILLFNFGSMMFELTIAFIVLSFLFSKHDGDWFVIILGR